MKTFPTLSDIEQFFMMACSLLAAIIGYINRKKFYKLWLFYIYPLASFIQMAIFYAVVFSTLTLRTKARIENFTINIFLLIEVVLLYHFFLSVFKSYTLKRILYGIGGIYLLWILYFWFMKDFIFYKPKDLLIYQAVVILVPCIIYFFELLKLPSLLKLSEDPQFWIAIGTIIYFGCTLPLFLLLNYIIDKDGIVRSYIYFINYICYSVFFLFIAKAYLCTKNL